MTHRERLLQEASKLPQIAYLLAPEKTSDPLTNLGSLGSQIPDGELKGDAHLVYPGLVRGGASVSLDGSGDYVDSGWGTRTNLHRNPNREAGIGGFFTNPGAPVSELSADESNPHSGTTALKVETTGEAVNEGFSYGFNAGRYVPGFAAGDPVTYSEWISAPEGALLTISVRVYGENGEFISVVNTTNFTGTGTYERVSVSIEALPAATFEIRCFVLTRSTAQAITFWADDGLIEKATTEGDFFPTPTQLESGLAGWAGEPNESESDIGPFARGTSRVFLVAVESPLENEEVIFGASALSEGRGPKLNISPTGVVTFSPKTETRSTSAGAVSANTRALVGLAYDPGSGAGAIWVDGEKVHPFTQSQDWGDAAGGNLIFGGQGTGGSYGSFIGPVLPGIVACGPSGEQPLSDEEVEYLMLVMAQGGVAPAPFGPSILKVKPQGFKLRMKGGSIP